MKDNIITKEQFFEYLKIVSNPKNESYIPSNEIISKTEILHREFVEKDMHIKAMEIKRYCNSNERCEDCFFWCSEVSICRINDQPTEWKI